VLEPSLGGTSATGASGAGAGAGAGAATAGLGEGWAFDLAAFVDDFAFAGAAFRSGAFVVSTTIGGSWVPPWLGAPV